MDSNSKKPDPQRSLTDSDRDQEPIGYQHAHDGGDWDHRPNDHLVEPLFGGLGAEPSRGAQPVSDDSGTASSPVAWLALGGLVAFLVWWLNS